MATGSLKIKLSGSVGRSATANSNVIGERSLSLWPEFVEGKRRVATSSAFGRVSN